MRRVLRGLVAGAVIHVAALSLACGAAQSRLAPDASAPSPEPSAAGPTTATPRPSRRPFLPSRRDYAAFRAGAFGSSVEELAEPNYLPFMAHRFEVPGESEDLILFCRWPDEKLPISVYVEAPEIAEELQDHGEFHQPSSYLAAAEHAFATWEQALPDAMRFEHATRPEDADLRMRLLGGRGPSHGSQAQVLGSTPILRACRVTGGDPAEGRLEVEFDVPWVEVYVADRYGLLEPNQVGRVALHEVGHALGMRGHSPIPAHLMFGETRGRPVDELSAADVNSFRALYAIPNGTLYTRAAPGLPPQLPAAGPGPAAPVLGEDAVVDRGLGFSLRVPEGWQVVREPQGLVAIDGVVWDYDASFSVTARGYQSVEGYLEQNQARHLAGGVVQERATIRVAGRPARSMRVYQPRAHLVQQQVFLATGDGRVLILVAEAPAEAMGEFSGWFSAILESFEVQSAEPRRG